MQTRSCQLPRGSSHAVFEKESSSQSPVSPANSSPLELVSATPTRTPEVSVNVPVPHRIDPYAVASSSSSSSSSSVAVQSIDSRAATQNLISLISDSPVIQPVVTHASRPIVIDLEDEDTLATLARSSSVSGAGRTTTSATSLPSATVVDLTTDTVDDVEIVSSNLPVAATPREFEREDRYLGLLDRMLRAFSSNNASNSAPVVVAGPSISSIGATSSMPGAIPVSESPVRNTTSSSSPPRRSKRPRTAMDPTVIHSDSPAQSPAGSDPPATGLYCGICLNLIPRPALSTTVCGHAFCYECLTEAFKHSKKCPACRKDLRARGSVIRIFSS